MSDADPQTANEGLGEPVPERVLVVAAHPDDIDFGASATVARLTDAGADVTYAIATDGDAGEGPEGLARTEVGPLRQEEQRRAGKEVGVDDIRFLGFPDGRVEATLELRGELSRVIRDVRPELVISQSPDWRWDRLFSNHPDHLAVGQACMFAVYPDARNAFAHPELLEAGLEPHTVSWIWVMGHADANHFVDVTDTIDRKVAALRAHESQTATFETLDELIRGWGAAAAAGAGWAEGRVAEGFLARRTG